MGRLSIRVLRLLLAAYPREFRERFGADLERDFADLLETRGAGAAWTYAWSDLRRAMPMTHRDDQRARQRRYVVTLGAGPGFGAVWLDLRHAIRALIKTPLFTIVTVATLALGIGATTAIFSLVNAALLRPLGYHQPDRLMTVHEQLLGMRLPRAEMSPPDFLDLRQLQRSFTDVGAYRTAEYELSGAGISRRVNVVAMSPSVIPLLGVAPAKGRLFTAAEEQSPSSVAIVTAAFVDRVFGGEDPIGRTVTLDRRPYTVVGVMPPGFEFPKRGPRMNGVPGDVFTPLWFNPFERQARGSFHTHSVIGRLRDEVTPEQAIRDVNALGETIRANYPAQLQGAFAALRLPVTPLESEISGDVRRPLLLLLGAVSLVLVIACANVANLMLSRAVTRRREIGVRIALGAAANRLFQMLFIESLLLAALGGVLGLLAGQWAVRFAAPAVAAGAPAAAGVSLDGRVLAFTLVTSIATARVFGIAPLVSGLRRDGYEALRGGRTHTAAHGRLPAALVVASVALAFVLLVGSGLLGRSLVNVMSVESGVGDFNVVTMNVMLPYAAYNQGTRVRSFGWTLRERLAAIPGVRAAAIATDVPIRGDGERRAVTPENLPEGAAPLAVAITWLHGDYFDTYRIPVVRGRLLTDDEMMNDRRAAVVSRGFAERVWPGEDPIGKRFMWGVRGGGARWQTVVGVVADVADGSLTSEPLMHIYVPYAEMPDAALGAPIGGLARRLTVAVSGRVEAASLAPMIRAAIAEGDPALAVSEVSTLDDVMREVAAPQRFSALLMAAFAGVALLLAAIGLYGVLAFGVSQRTREIGVRLALGAPRRQVLGLVVRQGMVLAATGLLLGGVAAAGAARLLQTQLFGTGIYDPLTFGLVPIVLAVVSLAACYIPARRAAVVDPVVTLRPD
ncbi:MAG TPA: ABC transporter permease [Vicinamibacterales bacterium]|nr:ABC transporter permease [Vicinamibacterales bacterium]